MTSNGIVLYFLIFQQRAVGRFSEGKPRDLRALRVRRRGALPLPSCQKLTVAAPAPYLSSQTNRANREYLFLFTTRSLTLTRDHEAKQAWFNGRGSRGSRNGISRTASLYARGCCPAFATLGGAYITKRRMPSFIIRTLKFKMRPTLMPESFIYVSSWASWIFNMVSTHFSSTITCSLTNKSTL